MPGLFHTMIIQSLIIPCKLLKAFEYTLLRPTTHLINLSAISKAFPMCCKEQKMISVLNPIPHEGASSDPSPSQNVQSQNEFKNCNM